MYFYHPDPLGSSSYITDREGRIIQHTEYIAFGEVLFEEHSTSKTMPYLFNGKELDTETGLYYYGARYYDPRVSLWLNVDPLTEKTMTPYAYTNNNPINLIDPMGMEAEKTMDPPTNSKFKGQFYKDLTGVFIGRSDGGWDATRNDGSKETILAEVVLKGKSRNNSSETNWATPLGQANYLLGVMGTSLDIKGASNQITMYNQGFRRGLNGNYQLKGRNLNLFGKAPMTKATTPFSKVAEVGATIGKASLVVGIASDAVGVAIYSQNPSSQNAIHPAKFGINTAVSIYSVKINPAIGIIYFGVDAFYPGGWIGDGKNAGVIQDQSRMINETRKIISDFNMYRDRYGK